MTAASISSASSALDLLRLKPPKSKTGSDKQSGQPDAADAVAANPSADLLRMIQGIMKPTKPEKSAASDKSQDIYAEIKVGGKTVATIYNDGSADTSTALAGKTKLSDGQGPDVAQKRAEELAASAGGAIVKPNSAIGQAQWAAQQVGKPGTVEDPVSREKQRSYSGLQERSMIADPSMLLQAQLFAQQEMGFDAKSAMSYVPPLDDRMSAEGTTA